MSKPSKTQPEQTTSDEFSDVVHEVTKGSRTSVLFGLSGHVLRIALQALMGRVLGAHAYGLYTLGRSILTVIMRFGLVGMHNAVIRFLAIYRGEGDAVQLRGTILASLAFVLGISSALGVGLWVTADWLSTSVFNNPDLGGYPTHPRFCLALPCHAHLTCRLRPGLPSDDVLQRYGQCDTPVKHPPFHQPIFCHWDAARGRPTRLYMCDRCLCPAHAIRYDPPLSRPLGPA